MLKGKYAAEVLAYAQAVADGTKPACREAIQGCKRFLRMIDDGEYDVRTRDADFVIGIIEKTFKHRQGEALDGRPLRGEPVKLEPWEKYIAYAMLIFYRPGTDSRVVVDALKELDI